MEQEETKEETGMGKIEIEISISGDGSYTFSATEGVHPMFLVGLLHYSIDSVVEGNRSDTSE